MHFTFLCQKYKIKKMEEEIWERKYEEIQKV